MRGHLPESSKLAIGLVALTLVVQAVFLAVAAYHSGWNAKVHEPDSRDYLQLAQSLATQGSFTSNGLADITRTPGYPLLLAPGAAAGHTTAWALLLQWLIKGWTAWLLFQVALQIWQQPRVAAAATLFYALEPMSQLYAGKVLTETSFTAVMLLCTLMLLRYLAGGHWSTLLMAAFAVAVAAFIRPIAFYLPPLLAVLIVLLGRGQGRDWKPLCAHAMLFLIVAQGTPGLWQVRNAMQTGYRGFCAIADVNLYFYQAAAVQAVEQGRTLEEVQQQLGYLDDPVYFQQHPEQRDWNQAERFHFIRDEGLATIRQHPLVYARIHWQGIQDTLLSPGNDSYLEYLVGDLPVAAQAAAKAETKIERIWRLLREHPFEFATRATLRIFIIGLLALAAAGLVRSFAGGGRQRVTMLMIVAGIVGYLLFLSGGPVGYFRFRVPITPYLCLLAGVGAVWLGERCIRRYYMIDSNA